jgi:predicted HTH transcriptional regulator
MSLSCRGYAENRSSLMTNVFAIERSIIKKSPNGRITAKQIEKEIGDGKNKVHYALKYLLKEHKVKKVRGLG